jgi:hypothetical protein
VPMGGIGTVRLGKLGRCAAHSCILMHESQSGCHADPFGTLTAMGQARDPAAVGVHAVPTTSSTRRWLPNRARRRLKKSLVSP